MQLQGTLCGPATVRHAAPGEGVRGAMGCIACMYTHPWRQALKLDAPCHKGGQQLAGPQEAAGADAVQQQAQLAELDAALIVRKPCRVGICCT